MRPTSTPHQNTLLLPLESVRVLLLLPQSDEGAGSHAEVRQPLRLESVAQYSGLAAFRCAV
jgi:hypothetical protein